MSQTYATVCSGIGAPLRVLVGCERSGIVRDAFRNRGHDAWSCDLKPCERDPAFHIQGDVFQAIDSREWDLGIFHPMCTYLTISAAWAFGDGPYHQRVKPGTLVGATRREARREAVDFVWRLLGSAIPRVAIENPVGYLSSMMRKPDQIIQPHQFGADASKATCLWLRGLPALTATQFIEPRLVCCGVAFPYACGIRGCPNCNGERKARPRWSNQTDSGQNRLSPGESRATDRSRTYPGIADAMAEQWGAPC